MLSYLHNGYKILILVISFLGLLGILACAGLLWENLKNKKSKITTIVSSVITGVSVLALVLPITIGAVVNNNRKNEYLANTKNFSIDHKVDIDNVFDGLNQETILAAKKAEKVVIRNYQFAFNYGNQSGKYVLAKDNKNSVIGFVNHNIDYFYYADATTEDTKFSIADKNFAIYRNYVKNEISNEDVTLEEFNKNLKRFDFSSYVEDFTTAKRKKLFFQAEIVTNPETLIGKVLYKDNSTKLYEEAHENSDAKLKAIHFTFNVSKDTESKYPEKTSGYIIL